MEPRFNPTHYMKLSPEDFDAIVTGELTHFAIAFEDILVEIITEFFSHPSRQALFRRLLLRREGLTFQDKIDILRAMVPEFEDQVAAAELKKLLTKVEVFKADRNAFAHGHDVTPKASRGSRIHVVIVNRAGKEKTVEVTPESHAATLNQAEELLKSMESVLIRFRTP